MEHMVITQGTTIITQGTVHNVLVENLTGVLFRCPFCVSFATYRGGRLTPNTKPPNLKHDCQVVWRTC